MMKKSTFALIAVAGLATAAAGQTGATYELVTRGMITPTSPSVTIEVWATWTGALHLFGAGDYDLNATVGGVGDGTFSNAVLMLTGPGGSVPGIPLGSNVTGAAIGQIHLPSLGFFGNPANPILLATYTWSTTDFSPRIVDLDTSNTGNFLVAWEFDGPGGVPPAGTTVQLFPANFSPGSGFIVIPPPSSLALLGLGGLVITRRRR